MKRFISVFFTSIFISVLIGIFIFTMYRNSVDDVISMVNEEESFYMLMYGTYNSKDKINKLDIDNYFVINTNNYYEVYVGITKKLENANKIRGIYKEKGNSIYIREKNISNLELIEFIKNKEVDIENKSNEEIINIENEIINKYKELYE